MRTRVKICCISSVEEAKLAISCGADALGLVAEMPSGPGPISDVLIAEIALHVPPPVATFLLTSRTLPDEVVEHVLACKTQVVQLVDAVPKETYAALRRVCPNVKIVQVIHVEDDEAIEESRRVWDDVDALLLDSGRPKAKRKELGGTGRVHNWAVSQKIVQHSKKPVFLAGGLCAENIDEALRQVGPYGVDLCSGVRTEGKLDPSKLLAFLQKVHAQTRSHR